MTRDPLSAAFGRKLPIVVAVSVLGVAFSLASLRVDAADAEKGASIADAHAVFAELVSEKSDQITERLSHAQSLTRGIYASMDTGFGTRLTQYLDTAVVFESNPALRAVAIVDLKMGTPAIVQIATPDGTELIALSKLVFAQPTPNIGSNLYVHDDQDFEDRHLVILSYRPSSTSETAAIMIFDGKMLIGSTIAGGRNSLAVLSTPNGDHKFLGYEAGSDPNDSQSGSLPIARDGENAYLQEASVFEASTQFDRNIEVDVFGTPWQLQVTMTDDFLQIPENREADAIVGAGVLLALLGYFTSLQILQVRERDKQRVDIAELGRSETEKRLIQGYEQSPIGVAELSFSGRIIRANASMNRILGLPPGALDDKRLSSYLLEGHETSHKVRLQHLQKQGFGSTKCEMDYFHTDGSIRLVRANLSVVPKSTHRNSYILFQAEDATEEQKAREELSERALRDELTGIPNRALFSDRLAHELASRAKDAKSLAVMFVDVDHIKVVNDSLGHTVGDTLITEMAHRLKATLRDSDTVARFGGDEFVILANDMASNENAIRLAEKICRVMREPYDLGDREIRSTVSIGVTLSFEDADVETMLRNADIALYRAKDNGRDRAELFTVIMHDDAVARHSLAEDLRVAIIENQLRAWYQPIVSAATGEIKGVEALIRWEHPTRGLLSPFHFLGIAAEIGLMSAIDDWILEASSTQIQSWSDEFAAVKDWTLSVNATPKHLLEAGYTNSVSTILAKSNFAPSRLVIEVTEDSMLADLESAAEVVRDLASMDIRVAIDDFGTGYSSMSMLAKLKINRLKIDASFVQSMRESHESASIVQTCISLAQSLMIPVVAEGVEELEDLAAIIEAGADLIQGYVYSRPQSQSIIGDILIQHDGRWPQIASSPIQVQSA